MTQYIVPSLIIAVAVLFGGFGIVAQTAEVILHFTEKKVEAGSPIELSVTVNAAQAINVVSGTITYPSDVLSVEVLKNPDSPITVWVEEPRVSEPGEILFAGGTNSSAGITDSAELFTLRVIASSTEEAHLHFLKTEAFASNGQGTRLKSVGEDYIVNKKIPLPSSAGGGTTSTGNAAESVSRSDFDSDGKVTLGDLSILMVQMLIPYDKTYDINEDKKVNLDDLTIFMSALGKIPEAP